MRTHKVFIVLTFIAAWEVVAVLVNSRFLPSPLLVGATFWGLLSSGALLQHAAVSLARVMAGFLLAIAVGLPLGVLMGWSPKMENFSVIIEMLRPIPPLAWIPLAMLWFGIGFQSKAFIIFIGALFPILSNALLGVRETEPYLVEAGKVLGASDSQILQTIILPNSFPSILEGLRIGLGIAWMCLVAAELTGLKTPLGLGYLIMEARDLGRADTVMAGMIAIGVIGYVMNIALKWMENRLVRWKP
ncbi:MAG: ABC transporter permease [Theionarchaea archaeon]|nr:ABC transporter permease [Theionarchaea archaeon]MBU7000478.1 ABC transporter permease [Theionarchaea archaeon]MBU7019995.1 ABC transporter permease [Theionarchaea archaeon]MBU7035246.1 ABC transporter permease [Theionarchaea archaeon]MBU7040565.1 ABC transporter permease [Theionarchaea archaeon]